MPLAIDRRPVRLALLAIAATLGGAARADTIDVAVLYADVDFPAGNNSVEGLQAKLLATGLFGNVDLISVSDPGSTPSLATLNHYASVLSYTNYPLDDPTALGDVLADYADGGRGVVLAAYGLGDASVPFGSTGFAGRITTPGYSPLVVSGDLSDLDGALTALVPGDPVFAGVDLAGLTYYHDASFGMPALDAGATLLATDGSGVNLLARSAAAG